MRMLVLGAGLQGSACAYDLLQQRGVERVTLADLKPDHIPRFVRPHVGKRLALLQLDLEDGAALREAMDGQAAVLNAAPYYFNLGVSRAAVDVGVHCADLGGNTEIVFQQRELDAPRLTKSDGRDLVVLRVEVRGRTGQRATWQLLDYYDEACGISAMMRTTGYSLAITGLMQADGRVTARGVRTPDEAVPFGEYVAELAKRGIAIQEI